LDFTLVTISLPTRILKVFLQTLYGTNLPYNIPGSERYRNALEIPAYFRVDLGSVTS
jgi:hypothetical protein